MTISIKELFVDFIPRDLFRKGTKSDTRLSYLRTAPPRDLKEKHDIEVYVHPSDKRLWVKADAGGISVFDKINPHLNSIYWYKLPKGSRIPHGLRITRDDEPHASKPVHYTIRPIYNMPLQRYVSLLESLAKMAIPTFEPAPKKSEAKNA